MSDNYEFSKSCLPQGVANETPYVSKNWNYVNDINGQSYSNNGLTLVQFDLSSIYNSTQLIDPSQMYMAIPITYVSAYATSAALVAPVAASWASTGLKNGYFQMLHGADVVVNGKTIEQFQPNLNAYITFKMLSQMSADDLATLGTSLGMGDCIDKWESMVFNGGSTSTGGTAYPSAVPTAGLGGNGVCNNSPFTQTTSSGSGDQPLPGAQFTGTCNKGLYSRMKKIQDTSTNSQNNMFGTSTTNNITQVTKLTSEFKSNYSIAGTYYSTWTDVAIIRMCDVFDSFKQMPLMKKLDCTLRLYFNTGTVVTNVKGGNSTGFMVSSGSGNTFTNTCPLIQANLMSTSVNVLPASAITIGSGLFIGGPTNCSLNLGSGATSVNLNQSQGHFMTSCRMYYPQIQLKPEKLLQYIPENRAKKICYTSVLTNTFAGITAGSTSSFLVQSGVSNPRGLLILPFIASTVNGASTGMTTTVFSQLQSPFDTAPATNGPLSLTNLQISIGGVNVLSQTVSYGYEEFLEQVLLYEKINASDLGLSCGLINQSYWDNGYRAYYVDVSRANIADLMTPRNINITFTNNCNLSIDCLVFTEYFKEITLDVETGIVSGL